MSVKTLSWVLIAAPALGAVLLLNYWASFQPLCTLAYAGFVLALFGLANLIVPFRFLQEVTQPLRTTERPDMTQMALSLTPEAKR